MTEQRFNLDRTTRSDENAVRSHASLKLFLSAALFGATLGVAAPSLAQGTDTGGTTTAPTQPPMATPEPGATAGGEAPAAPGEPGFMTRAETNQVNASNVMDADVVGSDDQRIGEVDDMILDEDGRVVAVTVDVGGFLGIGQKTVAIPIEAVEFVPDQAVGTGADPATAPSTAGGAPAPAGTAANGSAMAPGPAPAGTAANGSAMAPGGTANPAPMGTATGGTGLTGFNWGGGELEFIRVQFTRDQLQNAPAFEDDD